MIRRAEDVIQNIPVEYDVNEVLQDVDTRAIPRHQEEVVLVVELIFLPMMKLFYPSLMIKLVDVA
jgi:hypothetical protein